MIVTQDGGHTVYFLYFSFPVIFFLFEFFFFNFYPSENL